MRVAERTDAALVEAARAGDRAAFGEIYERYADRVYGLSRTVVRRPEDAADVTHDTFVRAAERLDQLRDPSRLRPWLFSVARNEALQLIRRTAREDLDDGESVPPVALATVAAEVEAVNLLSAEELRDLVWDASAGLEDRDRVVLDLYVREGLEGAELGEAMGVSTDYAYQLTRRVRTRIDGALGALLIARLGRRECPELRELLADWDGTYTPALRRRVVQHVDRCETCSRNRSVLTSPAALFATIPLLPVPFVVKGEVLAAIESAGLLGGSATAASAASGSAAGSASGGGAQSGASGGTQGGVGTGVVVGGLVAAAAVAVVIGIVIAALASDDSPDVAAQPTGAATIAPQASGPPDPSGPSSPGAVTTAPGVTSAPDPTTQAPAPPALTTAAPGTAQPALPAPTPVGPSPRPTSPPPAAPVPPTPPPAPVPPTPTSAPSAPTTSIATTTTTTTTPPPPAPAVRVRVDPGVVDLGASAGTATVTVANDGTAAVAVTASAADARITVAPAGGTVPPGGSLTLTVTLDRAGLPAVFSSTISLRVGTFSAPVQVRASTA